ncbi:MAG: hypothetical protein ACPLW8_00970 [Candidatus Bathyarchaeales archaeon]
MPSNVCEIFIQPAENGAFAAKGTTKAKEEIISNEINIRGFEFPLKRPKAILFIFPSSPNLIAIFNT